MSQVTVCILIKGKVQGVFFRKYTCDAARKYGITGFVRNEPDGNVYVEATGNAEPIQQFIQWCHKGSPLAGVDAVIVQQQPLRDFTNFNIRY